MPEDPYSQNGNGINNPYTPSGYEKTKLRKLLLMVIGILAAIAIIALVIHFLQPESQQSKYIKSATAAAREHIPNAEVTDVKVAGGFALAVVSDPTAEGQANAGNTTVFKVNKDGSMDQLANGSYFSPLNLLELGIPLTTQAKLTGSGVGQVKQNLADQCGYSGGSSPGYSGFNGSFNPDGWQIDSATLGGLEQALSHTISAANAQARAGKAVVCVDATQRGSNATTDTKTYVSTFTLQLQFVTSDGTLTTHTLTFATGPNYYRNYTLDGRAI
jgi:hypothetical protein